MATFCKLNVRIKFSKNIVKDDPVSDFLTTYGGMNFVYPIIFSRNKQNRIFFHFIAAIHTNFIKAAFTSHCIKSPLSVLNLILGFSSSIYHVTSKYQRILKTPLNLCKNYYSVGK